MTTDATLPAAVPLRLPPRSAYATPSSKSSKSTQRLKSRATLNKPSKISAQTWMTQFFGLLCLSRGPFGQFAGR